MRTKCLRDVVRAMGQLRDIAGLSLARAGTGEEIEICRAEVAALVIADQVRFLDLVPRARIEDL